MVGCWSLEEYRPPVTLAEPDYVTARVGDIVEVQCSATGHPEPHVQWTRGPHGELARDILVDGGRMRFRATGKDQEGVYECTGSSSVGSSVASTYIVIEAQGQRMRTIKNLRRVFLFILFP